MNEFMMEAVNESINGVSLNYGGPFGSVVVKDGDIIGRGCNRVLIDRDPTAHGEIVAIRDACRNRGTYDLSGCVLYTNAEPCPMCLSAIIWANIKVVYYGVSREDASNLGFRDSDIYEYIGGKNNMLEKIQLDKEECLKNFNIYDGKIY